MCRASLTPARQATTTKGMAQKGSGERFRKDYDKLLKELYDKLLKELVGVKVRELKVVAERRRLVSRISLIAPGKSALTEPLTEQRRWNASVPPLHALG
jgi:hypothetical protein